ncbi:MAG: hypothetical protein NUV53_02910 [Patescibacteria group bacterium]|nr:hypothetical protein [Patescibacteria group bacterium]
MDSIWKYTTITNITPPKFPQHHGRMIQQLNVSPDVNIAIAGIAGKVSFWTWITAGTIFFLNRFQSGKGKEKGTEKH